MKNPSETDHPLPSGLRHLLSSGGAPARKPQVEHAELDARLAGSPRQWMAALSDSGFTSARLQSGTLELEAVQSLDLQGQPHEFVRVRLSPRKISLSYTRLPHQRPERRRLEAARVLLLTLGALPAASPPPSLSAWLSASLQQALESVSESGEQLLFRNSQLEEDNQKLRSRLESLSSQRESDARAMLSQAQALEASQARLEKLSALPDSVLDEEVMEWLRAHDGQISLREVAARHQVAPARVEESLDRLSKSGRIARTDS
ncbi:MAG: hypothetical protein KGH63_03195 [Candidatus Micrarchaeota archaeon]|nr:hypothetical protein [Candidatus Micrarchaeota archaeon]